MRPDTGGRSRWCDYSVASPDPNGEGIWVVGEFAAATANTWGVQAGLTYQSAPPPANDNWRAAQTISGSTIAVGGTNRYATREPGESDHLPSNSASVGEHTVWYSWTAPSSGTVSVDTCESSFDTILVVYDPVNQVTSDDDACDSPNTNGSRLTFNATAGNEYLFGVAGFFSTSEGTFTLRLRDTQPPRVTRVVPANLDTGISPATNVLAFFSERMRSGLIDTDTVRLRRAGTTTNIVATVTYDPATRKATLNPNANLQLGATYIATVTVGVRDLAGNQLDQDLSAAGNQPRVWRFTVRR